MASGDDIEAGRTTGASDRTILVGQKSRPSSDFVGDFIFKAAPQRVGGDPQAPDRDLDGIQGVGNRGGIGVVGFGGFMDRAGRNFGAAGVLGVAGGVAADAVAQALSGVAAQAATTLAESASWASAARGAAVPRMARACSARAIPQKESSA